MTNKPQPLRLEAIQRPSQWNLAVRLQNASSRNSAECRALISTASPKTIVSTRIAHLLELPLIGESKHNHDSTKGYESDCLVCNLIMPNGYEYNALTVDVLPLDAETFFGEPIDCLIGMDILSSGLLMAGTTGDHSTLLFYDPAQHPDSAECDMPEWDSIIESLFK